MITKTIIEKFTRGSKNSIVNDSFKERSSLIPLGLTHVYKAASQ